MEKVGLEIIEEPDRLLNLKYYYPEYYSDSLIYNKMKDTLFLNKLINYLKKDFKNINEKICTYKINMNSIYLKTYKSYGYQGDLNPDKVYCITLCKDNDCLDVYMIKNNDDLYFFIIKQNILIGHP